MSKPYMKEPLTRLVANPNWFKRSPLHPVYEQARFIKWLFTRRSGLPPAPQKRRLIRQYARQFDIDTFVETGTYLGGTVDIMRKHFGKVISIELDTTLAEHAQRRFSSNTNVTILHGDSAQLLPSVIEGLNGPALYWLDGHFSGGITARGALDTPLLQELKSILVDDRHSSVILIDDAHLLGSGDYPTRGAIQNLVADRRPGCSVDFNSDIVRIILG